MKRKHFITISIIIALAACSKTTMEVFVGFQKPSNFPDVEYNISNNPVTKEGFELGRTLFYDGILSKNNQISCGFCHIQSAAFTHHGHDISHGIDDRLGKRNSPPIMNLAWRKNFMWDGGVGDLDLQPIAPITNHEEMDEDLGNVLVKLRNSTKYPALFEKAFGSNEITTARLMKALSQFMVMCVSSNSKYDSVMRNQSSFTADEQAGYNLVKQKCGNCHKEPLFTDESFRDNGIYIGFNNDSGRYAITLNPADLYKFKVPSLRNLAYTAPFMHDGRYLNLQTVLNNYSTGVVNKPNLDPLLKQNGILGIPLTATEQTQIITFLNTLNDKTFINNRLIAEQ
jgi:cytochrome c peroxidase